MAMSLPLQLPTGPVPAQPSSNGTSPSSVADSPEPESPASQTALPVEAPFTNQPAPQQQAQQQAQNADSKRKPSRRANTAERRATHNAVERQRRETLNSRFLDLAGLLPNLSQIRRPSKSAIVNSSIAHVHASRRHRLMAARELRLLKLESDALRRELNEWRDRAGLPRCDEPPRSEAFGTVMSGEIELDLLPQGARLEEDDGGDYFDDGEDYPMPAQPPQQHAPAPAPMYAAPPPAMAFEEQLAMEQMMQAKAAQYSQVPRGPAPVFDGALYPVGHPAHYAAHAPTYGVRVTDMYSHARSFGDESDASSVGSGEGMAMGRARSGSNASGYGSPGGSYEHPHAHYPMTPVREEMVHHGHGHGMMRHPQMQQMGGGGSMHGASAYAMMM